MSDQYQYFRKHLTPRIARELILELFAGDIVQRQKIIRRVDEVHRERGGQPPTAKVHHPAEHALSSMKQIGLANNPKHGHWSIFSKKGSGNSPDSGDEWIIGAGKSPVYVYYYPTYRLFAESEGEQVWACKIGKVGYDERRRVESQSGTSMPEAPKIGLTIKTDDPDRLEQTIHNILKFRGRHKEESLGTEWFITSPNEVANIYQVIMGSSSDKSGVEYNHENQVGVAR